MSVKIVAPKEVRAGDIFAVHVLVNSPLPVRGMPMQLVSPELLQLTDVEDGAFFAQDGAPVSKPSPSNNLQAGQR
jgi:general secretion pathway protein D